jgi:hypothetical protein
MAKVALLEYVNAVCAMVALLVVVSDSDRVMVALLVLVNVLVGIIVVLLDTPLTVAVLVVRSCVMDSEKVWDASLGDHVVVRSSWQKHPSFDATASATSFQ